jgi:metallo-beta-lactamase family protein
MTLFGEQVPVRAEIQEMSGFSAHADKNELLRWCRSCVVTPGKFAVIHGEPDSATSFSATLKRKLGWDTVVPSYGELIEV